MTGPVTRFVWAGAGLVFVVLSIAGIATIGHFPQPTDPPAQFVTYFTLHRNAILTTNVLLSLANGALLIWFALLCHTLLETGTRSPLPTLAFGAAILLCALGAAGAMLPAGLAHYGTTGLEPGTVRLLQNIYYTSNAFSALPAALAVGARGALPHTDRVLPRWLSLVSVAIAVVELVATFTLKSDGDFFSPAGTYGTAILFGSLTAWVLLVTVTLSLTAARPCLSASRETPSVDLHPCRARLDYPT